MTNLQDAYKFKVLNLNLWGLFAPISEDREIRFKALANMITQSDYDVIILQEVWLTQNEEYKNFLQITANKFPYHASTENLSSCKYDIVKIVDIHNCAGLLTLSRHPLDEIKFTPYEKQGHEGLVGLASSNFEGIVGKGVLQTSLKLNGTLTIDIFNSHLVSFTHNKFVDDVTHNGVRTNQTATLIKAIQNSNADVKIFGTDLNAVPLKGPENSYGLLGIELIDSLIERYPEASWNPLFATHGREGNTYTGEHCPVRIDYLMHWADQSRWEMATVDFKIPNISVTKANGDIVSISDHEPLHAEYLITQKSNGKLFYSTSWFALPLQCVLAIICNITPYPYALDF